MQVGSLIFVVIVAIWAAYLLQHWVRRREDAAATRSIDGFSKAMRVLEKRPLLPQTELRAPRPTSYAVKPAAAARATIDVKRAVPAGAARSTSPLVARRASERLGSSVQSQPLARAQHVLTEQVDSDQLQYEQVQLEQVQYEHGQHEIDQQHPSDAHRGEVDRMPLSHNAPALDRPQQVHGRPGRPSRGQTSDGHTGSHASRQHGARPQATGSHRVAPQHPSAQRPAPHRVSLAQRRLRAALLLLALLWLPVSTVLAITGVLLWVSVPFAFVTLVAVLYWLRTEAEADRAYGAGPAARADGEGRADRRSRRGAPALVLSSEDTQVISHRVLEEARRATHHERSRRGRTPQTVQTTQTAEAVPAAHQQEPAASSPGQMTAYDGVFDVQAAQTGGVQVQPVTAAASVEQAPGSWSPVPVPVPTYALKAKAEPRYTDDGIPADVFDTPEFAEEAEELDDRALFARRAVSG